MLQNGARRGGFEFGDVNEGQKLTISTSAVRMLISGAGAGKISH